MAEDRVETKQQADEEHEQQDHPGKVPGEGATPEEAAPNEADRGPGDAGDAGNLDQAGNDTADTSVNPGEVGGANGAPAGDVNVT